MAGLPQVAHAVVYSQDPDNYGLNVLIQGHFGGQMPAIPVKVSSHGPRDGVRGHFPALPHPGQSGIVVFPRGDYRNGVWIGSFEPALNDANPNTQGTTGLHYHAHYAGDWSWRDNGGNVVETFADGSSLVVGAAPATPTRHTLDAKQARSPTPFTQPERQRVVPGAFPVTFAHKSGTTIVVGATGTFTATLAGGAIIAGDAAGNVTITATGTMTVIGETAIHGDVAVTGQITATGGIEAGFGTGDSVTLQHHSHTANNTPPTAGT